MANVNLRLPNGEVIEKKIITALEKYGNSVIAVENASEPERENNNFVVDVYVKADGMYQPAPFDAPVWDDVKHALSDAIHNKEMVGNYRVVEAEINAAMGKHSLALREANHDDIERNYQLFLDSLTQKETVETAVTPETTITEVQPVATAVAEEKPADVMGVPQSVIPDIQNMTAPKEEVASIQPAVQDIPVADTPIIIDSFANIPQPDFAASTKAAEETPQPMNTIVEEKKEEMVAPIPTPEPIASVVTPQPVIQEVQSIIPDTPVVNAAPVQGPQNVVNNSAVTDSYTNRAKDLEDRLNQSVSKLDAAILEFKTDVQEIARGLSELVKEGNAYHNLAGQAFDKVQEVQRVAMNNNIVSFPTGMIEEEPSLGKTA